LNVSDDILVYGKTQAEHDGMPWFSVYCSVA